MKTQKKSARNWWLLTGIAFCFIAGGLGVATDMRLLKVQTPQEMVRRFKRSAKRRQEIAQEGGLLWI